MSARRIAITGAGAICAIGHDVDAITRSLTDGRTGISAPRHVQAPFDDVVVGEVAATNLELTARLVQAGLDPPRSRTTLLALTAALEAVNGARNGIHTVVVSASTVGGMDLTEQHYAAWAQGDRHDLNDALEHPVDSHTSHVARAIGSRAMRTTISTACSSSANALIHGAQLLLSGRADRVLAGGADALCAFTMEGFRALSAMDPCPTRPFDPARNGMNLGEAAAYLVLERADDAHRNGRPILGYLGGWANRNDAHHQTATSPTGDGPYEAMHAAIALAGMATTQVDHVNAHGTGTGNNDDTELTALERLFDQVPPLAATKALTGHTLAAAGALEAVIALICMRTGLIPAGPVPTLPMEGHRTRPVPQALKRPVRSVLSNSFGFGGNDTALLLLAAD